MSKESMKETIIDAECNVCDWKGNFDEMTPRIDEDDVLSCPICKSQNVFFFNQPPRYSELKDQQDNE